MESMETQLYQCNLDITQIAVESYPEIFFNQKNSRRIKKTIKSLIVNNDPKFSKILNQYYSLTPSARNFGTLKIFILDGNNTPLLLYLCLKEGVRKSYHSS